MDYSRQRRKRKKTSSDFPRGKPCFLSWFWGKYSAVRTSSSHALQVLYRKNIVAFSSPAFVVVILYQPSRPHLPYRALLKTSLSCDVPNVFLNIFVYAKYSSNFNYPFITKHFESFIWSCLISNTLHAFRIFPPGQIETVQKQCFSFFTSSAFSALYIKMIYFLIPVELTLFYTFSPVRYPRNDTLYFREKHIGRIDDSQL